MKNKVFSIYDAATQVYSQPYFAVTTAHAIRSFQNLCKDPQSQLYQHPADFHLFELGLYDDQKGEFENLLAPLRISSALDHMVSSAPQNKALDFNKTVEQGA